MSQSLHKRLFVGSFNYGFAAVSAKVIGFLLIPIYTKYLTPADYGIVELTSTLSIFLIVFYRLGLPGSVSRFYFDFKNDENRLNDYVKTVHDLLICSSVILGVISSVILFFAADELFQGVAFFPYILLTIFGAVISSNSDVQKRILMSSEKSKYTAVLNISSTLIAILLSVLFVVFFKLGALGLMVAKSITGLLFFIQSQLYLKKYLKNGVFKKEFVKPSLHYGLGILPHHLFSNAVPLISRSFLASKVSLSSVGVYSLATRFSSPLDMLIAMVNMAYQPIYFSLRKENQAHKVVNLNVFLWTCSVIVFVLFIFVMPKLIPIVTPVEYHSSASLVSTISISFIGSVLYLIYTSELFYTKQTKKIVWITIPSAIANILFSYIFVENMGPIGLAIALALSSIISMILSIYFCKKYCETYLPNKDLYFGILTVLLAYALEYYLRDFHVIVKFVIVVFVLIIPVFNLIKYYKLN